MADVRGDERLYRIEWKDGSWRCSCPFMARTVPCSHILACHAIWFADEGDAQR